MKAIEKFSGFKASINRDVLALYLRHAYIPDPFCIYEGFFKLKPGSWIEVSSSGISEVKQYWDFKKIVSQKRLKMSEDEALDRLDEHLVNAVMSRTISDVPIGSFLSGGIDSGLITSILSCHLDQKIETFTMGFDVPGYNEAEYAKRLLS